MRFSFSNDGALAGAVVVVGGFAGRVNILRRDPEGSLVEEDCISSPLGDEDFGWDVCVSSDGERVAIGSPGVGAVHVYSCFQVPGEGCRWVQTHEFYSPDGERNFGKKISFTIQDAHSLRVLGEKADYEYRVAD